MHCLMPDTDNRAHDRQDATQYKSYLSSSFDVFTTGNYLLCQLLQVDESVKTKL